MQLIAVMVVLIVLASCASREDRMWSDMQTILEQTQPKKG